jgi:hypothetical protein
MFWFRKLLDQIQFFYQISWRIQSLYALLAKTHREAVLDAERTRDPLGLTAHGFTAYSQADEDGMIQELFRRIGFTDRRFIEFGCGDGLENNTVYLLLTGWSGLWMDGSAEGMSHIRTQFAPYVDAGKLQLKQAFLTRDNINDTIREAGYAGGIDLLSIDIDGNDYWLWEALTVVAPRAVIVEYNATFRPPHKIVQAYDEKHCWNSTNYFGASLKALEELGARKGYDLVGCCYAGTNAFFVRRDLCRGLFSAPPTAERHYREPQYDAFVRGAMRHRRGVGKYQIL